MALKRTLLSVLIFLTLIFLGYQLWLVCIPLKTIRLEKKYFTLVDQYQLLKMQRLVLEEKVALREARTKFSRSPQDQRLLANLNLSKTSTLVNNALPHPYSEGEPVSLSLQESKTFEQLEAYVSNNQPLAPLPLSNDEKKLLEVAPQNYTLQLMGVRDINELTHFVSAHSLQDPHIFHTFYLSKDWYVLVSGSYKNHTEALKAIDSLSVEIKKLKPWIRQLSGVQKAIQLYRG